MKQIFITPLPSNPKIQDTFFVSNANAVKIKITNADRIRAMTDDELAKFISDKARGFGEEYEGYMSALDWLREEASDERR